MSECLNVPAGRTTGRFSRKQPLHHAAELEWLTGWVSAISRLKQVCNPYTAL
jgi:hypothetical protein